MAHLIPFQRKLTWPEIRQVYQGQWIEIHDVEWGAKALMPRRARVRHVASDRKVLLAAIKNDATHLESSILFINWVDTVIAYDVAGVAA
jgi:hypothetical protein